jgi:hypothetical protein
MFWKNNHYAGNDFMDDRANAMAVLCGIASRDKYPDIARVLTSVFNSSPYMENYVLMALCAMKRKNEAYSRMMSRYQKMIDNKNSTLWEDFSILGTRNHAWSGAPLAIICEYFPELMVEAAGSVR